MILELDDDVYYQIDTLVQPLKKWYIWDKPKPYGFDLYCKNTENRTLHLSSDGIYICSEAIDHTIPKGALFTMLNIVSLMELIDKSK